MNWAEVIYSLEETNDDSITSVIEAINKTHANGGIICRCFRPLNGAAHEQASGYGNYGISYCLKSFLENDSVQSFLPELNPPASLDPLPSFVTYGSYEFEGAIISLLLSGGAYMSSKFTEPQARSLAQRFVDSILPDCRQFATVFRIDGAWTNWFCDVAWDATFVVFNTKLKRWWLICITDTD